MVNSIVVAIKLAAVSSRDGSLEMMTMPTSCSRISHSQVRVRSELDGKVSATNLLGRCRQRQTRNSEAWLTQPRDIELNLSHVTGSAVVAAA
jgi:hypothetical protein